MATTTVRRSIKFMCNSNTVIRYTSAVIWSLKYAFLPAFMISFHVTDHSHYHVQFSLFSGFNDFSTIQRAKPGNVFSHCLVWKGLYLMNFSFNTLDYVCQQVNHKRWFSYDCYTCIKPLGSLKNKVFSDRIYYHAVLWTLSDDRHDRSDACNNVIGVLN